MKKNNDKGITRRGFIGAAGTMAAGPLILRSSPAAADTGPYQASVKVEPEPLHALPQTQYGHFIEHLGKCIKGGIWAEGEQEDMFLGGVRWPLVEAIRSINPSLIRYPGGCFADGYHWQDGIGPRSSRPMRKNLAWAKLGPKVGPEEDNHFGTDEFIELCEAVGAEPMLTANVGSGTAEEAAAWVEYCNGDKHTKWGAERAKNGHPDPYRVKYWFVGNEIFGWHEIGNQRPSEYVNTIHAYARAMRKVDPDIKLIAVGGNYSGAGEEDANKIVLTGAGDEIDYLSIHQYLPPANLKSYLRYQLGHLKGSRSRRFYYDIIGTLSMMEEFLNKNVSDINSYSPQGKKVPLCFDEWNLWFNFAEDIVQTNYSLRDGLWVAGVLNLVHRRAPDVPVSNIAQMVNCLGIIISDERGTFLTPSALVFKLYSERSGETFLQSTVDCPAMGGDSGLPVVDVSATRTGNRVALFLTNRHYDAEAMVSCSLEGLEPGPEMVVRELYHPNPVKYNTFKHPQAVIINERQEPANIENTKSGAKLMFSLKPHSLACIELQVKQT